VFTITEAFIFPGFIDAHNHVAYNVLPKWTPRKLYKNRGQWHRARDTKLNRDVALKVLPPAVAHDSSRLARLTDVTFGFERWLVGPHSSSLATTGTTNTRDGRQIRVR
jgi:hypothetical protein